MRYLDYNRDATPPADHALVERGHEEHRVIAKPSGARASGEDAALAVAFGDADAVRGDRVFDATAMVVVGLLVFRPSSDPNPR